MRMSLATGAVAALLAGPVLADGFSYNNIELDFIGTEIEDFDSEGDLEGDGISIGGSVEFGPSIHGFASITGVEYEDFLDVGTLSLGLGFNHALAPQLDLFSGISYERLKLELDGFDDLVEEGYGLTAGLRGRVGERIELSAGLKYTDYGDGLDDTTIMAGGRYYFTRNFAAGLDYTENDDGDTWIIALRYDFGDRY
jgi:hypothetical protein